MVRFKNRYFVVEIIWHDALEAPSTRPPQDITRSLLLKTLQESVLRNFGEVGAGNLLSGMTVKHFNPIASIFIAHCHMVAYCYELLHQHATAHVCRPSWEIHIVTCRAGVSRECHKTFWSAVTFIRQLKDREVVLRVLNVSNLSRSCCRAALTHVRDRVSQVQKQLKRHEHALKDKLAKDAANLEQSLCELEH